MGAKRSKSLERRARSALNLQFPIVLYSFYFSSSSLLLLLFLYFYTFSPFPLVLNSFSFSSIRLLLFLQFFIPSPFPLVLYSFAFSSSSIFLRLFLYFILLLLFLQSYSPSLFLYSSYRTIEKRRRSIVSLQFYTPPPFPLVLYSFSLSSSFILLLLFLQFYTPSPFPLVLYSSYFFSSFIGSKGGNLEERGRAPEVNVNVSEVKGIVPEVLDVKQGSKGKNTGSKE